MSKIPVTKAGQTVLANIMTQAIQTTAMQEDISRDQIILSLITLLIGGSPLDRDLFFPVATHADKLETAEIDDLALQVISRRARVIAPGKRTSACVGEDSYQIGERVGQILGADVSIGRMDTAKLLELFPRAFLLEVAESEGLHIPGANKMTAFDLRNQLHDALPNWRPTSFATFTEDLS
ncbi:hypothetical protein J4P41_13010 [Gluconobacter sp. NFX36]|uniref:hypothetical protein n=1 Tax=Gluconobacter sp. NFX36 TaxID=2819535 RepID=UPI003CF8F987